MRAEDLNCFTCAYRDLHETAEPCASCDMYFSHFESSEPTDTAASEDARRCSLCKFRDTLLVQSPCSTCKYGDLPGTVGPCASCFDEGLDHPLNYEEATDSEDEGIVPQHIVDMFVEREGQEVRRYFEACDARPRPCPYCGEIPEVVGGKPSIPERNIAMSSATGPSFFLIAFPFMAALAKKR